ncbi:hypothetical protein ES705_40942 [subsurface metagenome]
MAEKILDNCDNVANWVTSDAVNFAKSQDEADKQEGTGSIKVAAVARNVVNNETKYPLADSWVRDTDPNGNRGGWTDYYIINRTSDQLEVWFVVRFNLSNIDSDSSISKADFSLYVMEISFGGIVVGTYRILSSWTEYGITWANKPGKSGTDSGSIVLTTVGRKTVSLINLVKSLTNGTYANYGWYIRRPDTGDHHCRVYSRDQTGTDYDPKLIVSYVEPKALNDTMIRDLGAGNEVDLSRFSKLRFWIKSSRVGTYLQFGVGETAWNNNPWSITVNTANTWEEKEIDIRAISKANKNAIRYLGLKCANADSAFTMKFDNIRAYFRSGNFFPFL